MSVCVQPVELPDGEKTWTVLGADHRHVAPVEEFLEYHRVTGRLRQRLPGLPEGWSPHWLRHTHAPALLLAGVPLHVVSRRLGHAGVQTTMDLYGWVTEDAGLRAAAGWRSFTEGWQVTGA
jgi:integrase/recombinase XerD